MYKIKRIGIVGTGFIGRGLAELLVRQPDLKLTGILTRRNIVSMSSHPCKELLTNSLDAFIEAADIIVECSGDVIYGTEVIDQAMKAQLPVITMNAELQVTTGSYFARSGFITEAEGDQPGCLAALKENAIHMGFEPIVYGNIKGFLNTNPAPEDMNYWSKRNGTSLHMTTSFTDGTKVQIEQVLVANGLNGSIAAEGLLGIEAADIHSGGLQLAEHARRKGQAISDYILAPKAPAGVFITAVHDQPEALRYYKMGEGPYYTLPMVYHLCHLEIIKTIRRVQQGGGVLLNNGAAPKYSVAAVAKHDLQPGERIDKGIGSFHVRGIAVEIARHTDHIPIGLLSDAQLMKWVPAGKMITFDDVRIPESLAVRAWNEVNRPAVIA